jgi:hypothetical protein
MIDRTAGKGASAMIRCESCQQQRPMNEAQGDAARGKLLAKYADDLETLRDVLKGQVNAAATATDEELRALVAAALAPPPTQEEQEARLKTWDPVDLLVPEWRFLQQDPRADHDEDPESGLMLSKRERGRHHRRTVAGGDRWEEGEWHGAWRRRLL